MKQEFEMLQEEMDDILAEPKPIVIPKTQTEKEIDKYVEDSVVDNVTYNARESLVKIIAQLEKGNYECEAGCLVGNVAFLALKKLAGNS